MDWLFPDVSKFFVGRRVRLCVVPRLSFEMIDLDLRFSPLHSTTYIPRSFKFNTYTISEEGLLITLRSYEQEQRTYFTAASSPAIQRSTLAIPLQYA